jgi:type IV fimbrial biogenesis protein FimT
VLGKRPAGDDDPSRNVGFNRGKTVVLGKQQIVRNYFIVRLRAQCRARGFTLIELMITLAVAAILLMIAVPSFKHILLETHLSDINSDLAGDLQYARTEAVSRQTNIAVAASSGSWQNGWTVQVPAASSTGTATVLRRHPAIPAQYVVNAAPASSVTYVSQGTLPTGSAGACFTISVPDGQNNQPRFLQVLPGGMLQQATGGTTPTLPNCTAP